ncbi:MAG: hypothetical protein ONB25_13540 [candidate division KSB1 bacterium]|nr:hypothetical protein [candidate division KSB1 bacterium]MDZ7413359.1 hypothetical protein [candidate division KSB1 bacterium]
MASVWLVFIGTAFMLTVGGVVALRLRGMKTPVFHEVGMFLLVMAAATAAFPASLPTSGWMIWAGS